MSGRFLLLTKEENPEEFGTRKLPQHKWFKRNIEVNNCVFSNVLKNDSGCGSSGVGKQEVITGSLISQCLL